MFPFVTKSGEHRFADFSAAEIDYQGGPAGIATIIDITHLVQIEEELRAANAESLTRGQQLMEDWVGDRPNHRWSAYDVWARLEGDPAVLGTQSITLNLSADAAYELGATTSAAASLRSSAFARAGSRPCSSPSGWWHSASTGAVIARIASSGSAP